MKNGSFFLAVLLFLNVSVRAQKLYTVSGGEIIFQSASVEKKIDGIGTGVNTNLRFTLFFHFGEYVHYDFSDNMGMFTGLGIRNVGLITDEDSIKAKFRTYNLGMPLALKFGSFKKNLFLFVGAEYEWMFHFKQKILSTIQNEIYQLVQQAYPGTHSVGFCGTSAACRVPVQIQVLPG